MQHGDFAPANPHPPPSSGNAQSAPSFRPLSEEAARGRPRPRIERYPSSFSAIPSYSASPIEVTLSYERGQSQSRPAHHPTRTQQQQQQQQDQPADAQRHQPQAPGEADVNPTSPTSLPPMDPSNSFEPFRGLHLLSQPNSIRPMLHNMLQAYAERRGATDTSTSNPDSSLPAWLHEDSMTGPHGSFRPLYPSDSGSLRRTSSSRDLHTDLGLSEPPPPSSSLVDGIERSLAGLRAPTTSTEASADAWDRLSDRTRAGLVHAERMCMTPSELRLISRVSARRVSSFDMLEVLARRRYLTERSSQNGTNGSGSGSPRQQEGQQPPSSADPLSDEDYRTDSVQQPAAAATEQESSGGLRRSASIRRSGFRIGPTGTPRTLQRATSTSTSGTGTGSRLSRRPASHEGPLWIQGADVPPDVASDFGVYALDARSAERRQRENEEPGVPAAAADGVDEDGHLVEHLGSSSSVAALLSADPFASPANDSGALSASSRARRGTRRSREEYEAESRRESDEPLLTAAEFLNTSV